jgi:exosortase
LLAILGVRFLNTDHRTLTRRLLYYGLWLCLAVALFIKPCLSLVRFSLSNDNASHALLIPLISAWVIFHDQEKIFRRIRFDYALGGLLSGFSVATFVWTLRSANSSSPTDQLSGQIVALVLLLISGFIFCFGREAARNGCFALSFLFLAVPIPEILLNRVIYILQQGSTSIAEMIFDLAGVPALREGFVFHLARINIEVARECSGIRSSIALLILALLVGHLFLRAFWKQAVFVICGLLVMIVKNGVRIATLSILAQYVDPGFLYGRLHHQGGVVFFMLGLLLLSPILWLLQRGENPPPAAAPRATTA